MLRVIQFFKSSRSYFIKQWRSHSWALTAESVHNVTVTRCAAPRPPADIRTRRWSAPDNHSTAAWSCQAWRNTVGNDLKSFYQNNGNGSQCTEKEHVCLPFSKRVYMTFWTDRKEGVFPAAFEAFNLPYTVLLWTIFLGVCVCVCVCVHVCVILVGQKYCKR
jgi:hypothetical protein